MTTRHTSPRFYQGVRGSWPRLYARRIAGGPTFELARGATVPGLPTRGAAAGEFGTGWVLWIESYLSGTCVIGRVDRAPLSPAA